MKITNYKLLSIAIIILLFAPFVISTNGSFDLSFAHAAISVGDTIINSVVSFVAILPVIVGTFLLFIAGLVLDKTLTETVVGFANFVDINGLNIAWETFRDLGNIFIVFVLLTIAIATIIGSSGYGLKALLAKVIIVALLLNFSLFFTKLVIEVTNRLAVEFYNQIVDVNASSGISAAFMQTANLNSFWDFDKDKLDELSTNEGVGRATIIAYGIFVGIFFSIMAAVFMFASFLLISRAVVLVLLMILSPLAFVAYSLPATKKHALMWWDALSKNALFAPIFLMLMWATFQVANNLSGPEGSFSDLFLGKDPASIKVVFTFAIIVGLAIASIVVAQKLSLWGGAGAVKGLKGLRRGAVGITARGALSGSSFAGRKGLSYLATKASDSAFIRNLKESPKKGRVGSFLSNTTLRGLDKAQTASLDVRQTKVGQSALKGLGIDAGKGAKGGVRGAASRAAKKDVETSKLYSASGDELNKRVDEELVIRGRNIQKEAEAIKRKEDKNEEKTGIPPRSLKSIIKDVGEKERKKVETYIKNVGRIEYARTRSTNLAKAIREDVEQTSQDIKDKKLLGALEKLENKE